MLGGDSNSNSGLYGSIKNLSIITYLVKFKKLDLTKSKKLLWARPKKSDLIKSTK